MNQYGDAAQTVAQHIVKARMALEYTRDGAARLAGVSTSTMYALEMARKPIYPDLHHFGYSDVVLRRVEQMLGWEDGCIRRLAKGEITEPVRRSVLDMAVYPTNTRVEAVPDTITLVWLAGMIERYRIQGLGGQNDDA